jgi:hypothetical protein
MNNLQQYQEAIRNAQEMERDARELVDSDLILMSEILRDHMSAAMQQISEEIGWLPPRIDVDMIDVGTTGDRYQHVLGAVTALI